MPKRLAITGPYQADILDYAEPDLAPHQVRVRTEVASGKHGTTLGNFDGRTFSGQRFDQEMRVFLPQAQGEEEARPAAANAGTTGVGTVIEVGTSVEAWRPGDRVFGLMDIRETNVCDADRIWALGAMDPHLALCLEPAYVAFHAVREADVRYGDRVAVIGLGALGLLAVSMCVSAGAECVFAIDPLAPRRDLARRYGADYVLDPTTCDAALEVHRLCRQDGFDNSGVDVAIELAGAYPALNTALRSLRVAGTVCSAGFYQGEAHDLWLGREWHHNRLTMIVPHGCGWGHPPRDYPGWDQQRAYNALVSQMRRGSLQAPDLIQPEVSLSEAKGVFERMRDHPDQVIKYAVRFPGA